MSKTTSDRIHSFNESIETLKDLQNDASEKLATIP